MGKLFFCCVLLWGVFFAIPAQADGISLNKVIVDFRPGDKPIDNINVTNQSDKPLKISVNTIEVTRSDLPDQLESPTDKLIAAPKAFEIAPGETRPVRLVLRGFPEDMESIYRVRFVPSEPTMQKTQEIGGKAIQVNVIVSMGALIMVSPKNVRPDLKFTREGDKIKLFNAGNITAQLQREDFCLDEERKNCVPLEGARIFPGVEKEIIVPEPLKTLAYTQTLLIDGKYSTLTYPAP